MDLNKPVVIIGSGPTATKIIDNNSYYVCALNLCSSMCERTDFWVVNDANFLNELSSDKLMTIHNLALPEFPHSVQSGTFKPHQDLPSTKVTNHLPDHIKVYNFNIQSSKNENLTVNPEFPYFETKSAGESAIKWLASMGFTKFVTVGMDSGGGRHKDILGKKSGKDSKLTNEPAPAERYALCHERVVNFILSDPKLKMVRLITDGVDDNIINKISWNDFNGFKGTLII